jgi:multiple antibiotic resistance protein
VITLGIVLAAAAAAASVQAPAPDPGRIEFSIGKTFTLLFLTLGPLKIIGPFAAMTRGRDTSFKRSLALEASILAAVAVVVCATVGAAVLRTWNISVGALEITAGIILFLVALKPVLAQYESHGLAADPPSPAVPPTVSALAFSPLAFPTIVTPYGIAVVIMLVTLAEGNVDLISRILGIAAAVLVMDFLVMLVADRILNVPMGRPALGIFGAVLGVLQIALGVQAMIVGLRMLDVLAAFRT